MTDDSIRHEQPRAMSADAYDPFARGPYPVGVRTFEALDTARARRFPCEVWYPAAMHHAGQDLDPATQDVFSEPPSGTSRTQQAIRDAAARPGRYPLIVFSHSSGGRRRQSTFLCTHLSSHGYVVAALDHSEAVVPALRGTAGETDAHRAERVAAWIANRVPDVRFLLDELLTGDAVWDAWDAGDAGDAGAAGEGEVALDAARIGLVGHSFGGWTALATPERDDRIRSVVALAPGGNSNPPPNMIPATLTFAWGRDVPTLYLVADDDTALPLSGMYELFARTQATKRLVILAGADHGHFADEVEPLTAASCSPAQAHEFVRGLTVCHFDATLRRQPAAERFWRGNVGAELTARGIESLEVQAL